MIEAIEELDAHLLAIEHERAAGGQRPDSLDDG
jgi:hypothetical protein